MMFQKMNSINFIIQEEKIMNKKKTFYITTPIYYPSGNMTLGNTYSTIICDTMARYKKEQGYDVYYLTGTDEHGQKIEHKAKEKGVTPQTFVDEIVAGVQALWKDLSIENDDFIRTTQIRHIEVVQKVFSYFLDRGDIYLGHYEGWYCRECEAFFTQTQLKDGKCPDCGREVQLQKEEAYFFKMSKYTDQLLKYYETHPDLVIPESRKTEMINNFIKPGLEDLCVSRTSFDWGIQVKENPKHVVYVWIDALLNYISALGYLSNDDHLFQKYWMHGDEKVHVLGKEITRFHIIYWPILLMALQLPLPDHFYSHGWLIMKDGKMSKSKGNVVYPLPLKNAYGIDALRYYLLREIPMFSDGLFTPEQFVERYNTDLANDLGNLSHRSLSMINKYCAGKVPSYKGAITAFDQELEQTGKEAIEKFIYHMDRFEINVAIEHLMNYVSKANKYIEDTKPWTLAKDESKQDELHSVMVHLANVIYQVCVFFKPILIEKANMILDLLQVPQELRTYEKAKEFGILQEVQIVEKPTPAFVRLDKNVEVEKMQATIYQPN